MRQQRVNSEVLVRRDGETDTRTDQVLAVQVVVMRVTRAVGKYDRLCNRERVVPIHLTGVAASIRHASERRGISSVVSLRRIRKTDVVAVLRRSSRGVLAGDHPRRDIGLGEGATYGPIRVAANRRTNRDVRHAPREVVTAEKLLRVVEGARREQIHLTGKRRCAEQICGKSCRWSSRAAEKSARTSHRGIGRFRLVRNNRLRSRGVLQNPASKVPKAPGPFAEVVGAG